MYKTEHFTTKGMYVASTIVLFVHSFYLDLPIFLISILAFSLVILLPGHFLLSLLFPQSLRPQKNSENIIGLWIIPVCSITVISIFGFILAFNGQLNQLNVILFLFVLSLVMALPKFDKCHFTLSTSFVKGFFVGRNFGAVSKSRLLPFFLVTVVLSGLTVLDHELNQDSPWLEFYVTGENGDIDSIPPNLSVNESLELMISVVNHGFKNDFIIEKTVILETGETLFEEQIIINNSDFVEDRVLVLDEFRTQTVGRHLIMYEISNYEQEKNLNTLQLRIRSY